MTTNEAATSQPLNLETSEDEETPAGESTGPKAHEMIVVGFKAQEKFRAEIEECANFMGIGMSDFIRSVLKDFMKNFKKLYMEPK